MPLFTFVLDYAGGTYLSQRSGSSVDEATRLWLDEMVPHETAGGASVEVRQAFSGNVSLVPVDRLTKVWCTTSEGQNGLALLNVTQTVENDPA